MLSRPISDREAFSRRRSRRRCLRVASTISGAARCTERRRVMRSMASVGRLSAMPSERRAKIVPGGTAAVRQVSTTASASASGMAVGGIRAVSPFPRAVRSR
jgi:hypothetical protein